MKRIVINPFDKESISEALEAVQKYKKDFEAKEAEFTRRLAEIGVATAQSMFAMADVDGVNDVVVSLEDTTGGYKVVASGVTVGFIEFGTGVKWRKWQDDGHVDSKSSPYTPPPAGSYGKGQGENTWGWWFYPNEGAEAQHTYGNPPAEAMLQARDNMVMYVTQIAREVWR
jgi:hypothetical protein